MSCIVFCFFLISSDADFFNIFFSCKIEFHKLRILTVLFSGDLGHVTTANNPQVEEGDSRYLANEVLQEVCNLTYKPEQFNLRNQNRFR